MAATKKRSIFEDAKDILAQGLISVRKLNPFFKQTSRDKRTVKSTQRAARELEEGKRPKEVADQLGISVQKWTAVKKQIREGKAYGPELKAVLREARQDIERAPITPPASARRAARQIDLESLPVPDIRTLSHDKRTVKSTQRAARELAAGRSPKEVADQLGISVQKWTSLKKQIDRGDIYGPEIKSRLAAAKTEYLTTPQQMENGVFYFPDLNKLKKTTHVDMIKGFPELSDALEWWESIVASDTYIAIAEKNGMYYVVGLGKRSQRPQKGRGHEAGAGNRVKQLLAKYKD
jgi:hypothetical protein